MVISSRTTSCASPDGRLLLMDFGAAARFTARTQTSDRAGTPLAMAPERFDRAALTPAVDVFGAGVVLYHWLEGRYPVIGSTATAIREQWARGVRLRFRRRGGPAALRRLIRTMLAADPDDRPTARSALRSIRRMRSAPVRRLRLGAALTVIGGLAIALIVSLTALDTADRAQRETEAVNRFLLDVLAAPRRTRLGPNLPLSALLEDSAARAEAQLADQPAALAGVLGTIGTGFVKLQRYDRAAELLERAERLFQELERDVQAVDVRLARADLAMNEARFDQARQIHRRILSGLASDDALSAMQRARAQIGLGQVELAAGRLEQARAELSSAFEMLDREPSIPNAPSLRAAALLALGELELRAGGYAAAREALEQAQAHFLAEVGPRHHNAAVARTSLIEALDRLGRLDEAAALAEQNVAINIDWLGPSDRLSIAALDALANIHSRRGDIDRALEVNAAALADASSDDPMLSLQLESNRVAYLLDAGQLRAALRLADDLLPRLVEDLGAGHTLTWTTALNKADALLAAGRPIDALSLARDLDRRIRARFGASHLFSRVAGYLIGGSLSATGEFEAAERLLVDHHAALDAQLGRSHPLTLKAAGLLAEHWQRVGRTEDARMLAGSAAQRAREALGPRHQRSRDLEALVQRLQSED